MSFSAIQASARISLLVSFFDLTGFARLCKRLDEAAVFDLMEEFFLKAGDIIDEGGGRLVKAIGDAGLAVFPEDRCDEGVKALLRLKAEIESWLHGKGLDNRLQIKAHFGPVVAGMIGSRHDTRFDVFGETVNIAALLESHGFSISPDLFRKLSSETRSLFKKHTPPVRYIPVSEAHRD